jgi:signal transduction histidine kinase/response regulator RpfG family c-di-GMP phosphodiesterase
VIRDPRTDVHDPAGEAAAAGDVAALKRRMEQRVEHLDRAIRALEGIARDGGSETVLRRIAGAFTRIGPIGKVTLWALRSEDGLYVEVARTENGDASGYPEPPSFARRAEALRSWWQGLPRFAEFAWVPAKPTAVGRPGAGDVLLVPLAGPDAPHWVGFLMAELRACPDDPELVEDLERWSALARLAVESRGDGGSMLSRLEELREEQREARDLHRMKSQFIAAVSHELRTPLTSISAYAEALRQGPVVAESETRERFLRVIHDESRRLARIVDDILDLATMDAGRVRLACRRIDLVRVVRDAVDVIAPIARAKGISIVGPSTEAAETHADPDLMKQLTVNLLENAVKFTGTGGHVRVDLEREINAVRLVVEDDGPGIPPEQLDAIFERFYQVDGADSREHGGSGLGLAICRSIVTWHDGRIWAESGEGRGARFVASLPRIRAVSRTRASSPDDGAGQREEHRIPELIIEMISEVMRAEAVSLMLLDDAEDELFIQAAVGVPDAVVRDVRVALGERIAGVVAQSGRSLLVPDVDADPRFAKGSPDQYRTRSLISVPVILRNHTIGVINVTNKMTGEGFTEWDRRLLEMLSQRVALVLQKLREYGDRRDSIERMEDAIHGVIAARRHYWPSRDPQAMLLQAVCEELGLAPDETTRLRYTAMLRDVGMTRLPEGTYRKPGRLTRSDLEAIRRHPEEGAKAIRPIEFQADVFDVILAHHEEPDGTGYPRGLTGSVIPRGARILAVVDAYEALRAGRPYKQAVGAPAAVEELMANAGSQFDAEVVAALVRVLERHGEISSVRHVREDRNHGPEGRS